MAKTTKANPSSTIPGQANISFTLGAAPSNALPLPQIKPLMGQPQARQPNIAKTQQEIDKEELIEDKIVLEELPEALEANAMGDVLMAQASVPAAEGVTTGAAAIPAAAASTVGVAGMSGLGLLGAAGGLLGLAAIGGGGGGGGGPPAPVTPVVPVITFTVTEVNDVVTFGGTAVGDITVSIDGNDVATFSRGGVAAAKTIENLSGKSITVAKGQTLVMTGNQMDLNSVEGVTINGPGNFTINANDVDGVPITDLTFKLNVDLDDGNLTFDMTDDNQDQITLAGDSTINLGRGDIIVSDGTVNLDAATLTDIGSIIINSKVILTYDQLAAIAGQIFTGDDATPGAVEVVITSIDDATGLNALLADKLAKLAAIPEGGLPILTFQIQPDPATVPPESFESIFATLAPAMEAIGDATGTPVAAVMTAEQALTVTDAATETKAYALTITDDISVVNANKIAVGTTGLVTAKISDNDAVTLAGLETGNAWTVTVTGEATAAQLNTIDATTSVPVNAAGMTALTLLVANVDTLLGSVDAGEITLTDASFTAIVTGAIGVTAANALANLTTGVVEATISEVDAATLATLEPGVENAWTVTVEGEATAAQLNTIDATTSAAVTATGVTALTGTADNFATLVAAATLVPAATITLADDFTAIVTGAITVEAANALAALTDGVVTATISDNEAATLVALETGNAWEVTVTGEATAAQLNTINGTTSVAVTATGVNAMTGLAADFSALVTAATLETPTITLAGNFTASVDDEIAVSAANDLAALTSAAVTATISDHGMDTLVNLKETGNAYTIAVAQADGLNAAVKATELTTLYGKTTVAVDVDAVATLTGTHAQVLVVYAAGTEEVTGLADINVNLEDATVTVALANVMDGHTAGVVTATIFENDMETLGILSAAQIGAGNAYTISVTDATVVAGALNTLDGKTSVEITATAVTHLTGTAANVATAFRSDGTATDGDVVVTLNAGTAQASDLNTIDSNTDAIVDALAVTRVEGLAEDIAMAISSDAIQLTRWVAVIVDAGDADAADLNTINANTTSAVNAAAVTKLSGSYRDVSIALSTADITGLGNELVILTDDVSVDSANAIAALTTGVITATIADGAMAQLNTLTTDSVVNTYTVTVTDTSVDAAALNALDAKTLGVITATAMSTISGSYGAVTGALASAGITKITTANSIAVSLSGTATVDQVNALVGNAAVGVITSTLSTGDMMTLAGLTGTGNAYSITLTDGSVDAPALNTLNGKTTVAINAASVSTITADAADVAAVGTAFGDAGITGLAGKAITITGDIAVDAANTVADLTAGVVTATVAAGLIADLNSALSNASGTDALTLSFSDTAAVSAASLTTLDGKTSVALNATGVLSVTGTAAEVSALYEAGSLGTVTGLGDEAVSITGGSITVAEANALAAKTSGAVTADLVETSLSAVSGLAETNNIYAISLADTAVDAAALNALDAKTLGVITLTNAATATLTGNYSEVNTALTAFASLQGPVTLTDSVTAVQAGAAQAATTGIVTATVSDTLANFIGTTGQNPTLVAGDALTLVLSETTATAADLLAADALTTLAIDLSNLVAISGSRLDIANVYAGGFTGLGNEAIGLTSGTGTGSVVTVADANGVASQTTGVVTASINATAATQAELAFLANNADQIGGSITNLTLAITEATAATARENVFNGLTDAQAQALFNKVSGTVTVTGNAGADWIDLSVFQTNGVSFTITAAAGDNVIYSGNGSDTITTGVGADYIEVGGGVDNVNAGEGDDIIAVRSLDNVDGSVYNGGIGTDTLTVYGTNDLTNTTLTSIETVEMLPGSPSTVTMTISQVRALDSVKGTLGNSELIIVAEAAKATVADMRDDVSAGDVISFKYINSTYTTTLGEVESTTGTNADKLAAIQAALDRATDQMVTLGAGIVVASFSGDDLVLTAATAKTGGGINTLTEVTYTNDGTAATATETAAILDVDLTGIAFEGLQKLTTDTSVTATLSLDQLADIAEVSNSEDQALTVDLNGETLSADLDISAAQLADPTVVLNLGGKTLTVSAAQMTEAVTLSGAGNVRVMGDIAAAVAALDMSNVGDGLVVTLVVEPLDADVTEVATIVDKVDAFEIGIDATLTASSAQLSGKPVTGNGSLIVILGTDAFDLTGIAESILASAMVTEDITLDASANLGNVKVTVEDEITLTATALQLTGKTVIGAGSLLLTGTLEEVVAAKAAGGLAAEVVNYAVTDNAGSLNNGEFAASGIADVLTLTDAPSTETDLTQLTGFETINLLGSSGAITIADGAGTSVVNTSAAVTVILGDGGQSFISTGEFDVNVTSGNGNDTITGGAGMNTVTYTSDVTAAMIKAVADVDAITTDAQPGWQVTVSGTEIDMLSGIEIVDGAESGKFLLVGNGGYATIQEAIGAATDGDTVIVAAGAYSGTVTLDKQLTIMGAQADVDGDLAGRGTLESALTGAIVFADGSAGSVINGLQIKNGVNLTSENAGIYVGDDDITISHMLIQRDSTLDFDNFRGMVTETGDIKGLSITDSQVSGFATGLYINPGSNATVSGNVFVGNNVGLSNDFPSTATIKNNTFEDNVLEQIGVGATASSDVSQVIQDGNIFIGTAPEVSIYGTGGADNIKGTQYSDLIIGGAGADTVTYTSVLDASMFTAVEGLWQVTSTDEGADSLTNIAIVEGTGGGKFLLVGNGGYATIQEAVNAAADGDTVMVADGNYAETVTLAAGKAVNIVGSGAATILDGAITIRADGSSVSDLTIVGGERVSGQDVGIYVAASSVDLSDLTLTGPGQGVSGGTFRAILTEIGSGVELQVTNVTATDWATGIYLNPGATNASVSGSNLFGNYVGMSIDGDDNVTLTNNTFNGTVEDLGLGLNASIASATGNTFASGQFGNYTGGVVELGGNTVNRVAYEAVQVGTNTGETIASTDGEDELIIAQDGGDVVTFTGNFSEYSVSVADGVITVTKGEETDTLTGVEAIKFADGFGVVVGMSIQTAVNAAEAGDTVVVGAGVFAETVTINERVKITGAGDTTVITGGVDIVASGVDVVNRIVLENVKVTNSSGDGIDIGAHSFITLSGVTVDELTGGSYAVDLNFGGTANDIRIEGSTFNLAAGQTGLKIADQANVTNLQVENSSFNGGQYGFHFANSTVGDSDTVSGTFSNLTFTGQSNVGNNRGFGIFVEKLTNSTMTGITVNATGEGADQNIRGINLNLKNGAFENISLSDVLLAGFDQAQTVDRYNPLLVVSLKAGTTLDGLVLDNIQASKGNNFTGSGQIVLDIFHEAYPAQIGNVTVTNSTLTGLVKVHTSVYSEISDNVITGDLQLYLVDQPLAPNNDLTSNDVSGSINFIDLRDTVLPEGADNLTLYNGVWIDVADNHQSGTGNNSDNVINGNDGNNVLSGGAGADVITGGAGFDQFVYLELSDSLAGAFDTITDFTVSEDFFLVSPDAETAIHDVGGLVGLDSFVHDQDNTLAEDIAAAFAVNGDEMVANGAATVTITGADHAGSYLIMNDDIAAFDVSLDAVIKLTNGYASLTTENFMA